MSLIRFSFEADQSGSATLEYNMSAPAFICLRNCFIMRFMKENEITVALEGKLNHRYKVFDGFLDRGL